MLQGLMQDQPLLISNLIDFAELHHGDAEIVSRRVEGDIHRSTWTEVARRARRVANALDAQGLAMSDRIATLAWNGYRHLELYYGVSGAGRVLSSASVLPVRPKPLKLETFDGALQPRCSRLQYAENRWLHSAGK